ncbi:MAG: histidine--tRNA ligase [Phycisphaeraceae bacterium]|nr:histidine--tRNA ligase [Phycisphaeraceae bacterium]
MKLKPPKGTRDFYPDDMARRRYLHDAWRRVSQRHGFDEVDGPIFESLDLYKIKSGDGIVSELFHFKDRGDRGLAIRPEFTPTLARMVAAQANGLPKPIKWFCTPNLCRAERPQRGRLREFDQWNIDMLGEDGAIADAEVIAVAVDLLRGLGVGPEQVKVKLSHREVVRQVLTSLGVPGDKMNDAFTLLDAKDKLPPEVFSEKAKALGLGDEQVQRFETLCSQTYGVGEIDKLRNSAGIEDALDDLVAIDTALAGFGLSGWCVYDLGIVRGLAYYTGTVFELHVTTGKERALGGGGRYDKLIELFGGPSMPAVGFGMGDVVLTNLLEDENLLPENLTQPKPDAYIIAVTDAGDAALPGVVSSLRFAGLHTRMNYKATRKVGKLLKDAENCGAKFAVILDDDASNGNASVKDLATGDQQSISIEGLANHLQG